MLRVPPTFARTSSRPVIHEPCGNRMVTWLGGLVCAHCHELVDWSFDAFKGSMAAVQKKVPFLDVLPNREARRAHTRAVRRGKA